MKKAQIISIGNELLIGDTINTNASAIGRFLTNLGLFVEQVITIPDDYNLIKLKIRESLEIADLTIVTGGLGPTHDDVTKKAVAELFNSNLVENKRVLSQIKKIFERRGFVLSQSNIEQALVPDVCEILFNQQGTAPGMWFSLDGNYLAVLPGVPYEMEYLMREKVIPKINEVFPALSVRVVDYVKTAGIAESTLSELIGNLDDYLNNGVGVAYLPNPGGVTLRLSADGGDTEEAENKLLKLRQMVDKKAGNYIYGKNKDESLAEVVGKLLVKQNLTIAVAESCTGGLIANEITNIPGCSTYMMGGVVAYSNSAKARILGVEKIIVEKHGAVSKQVALQMAKNVALKFGTDIGISTTGIAGPGGGTSEKPVGTIWMGFWIKDQHFALKTIFTNNRLVNKQRSVMVVLETVRRSLLGIKTYPYELNPHFS